MIDKATVERIIDAADIVDVVSDFVSLTRRGTNYVGLCPFHNDRRPSFYVSRTKGICKCFSCGKGGSAVNFIMEHEQMSYVEALRFLAKKFNIEIHERELTDEEKDAQSERESMMVINEFAMQFFENQAHNTTAGQEIAMSYFRERGFTDESIKKFHLGYSPESRSALFDEAVKQGYNKKLLFDVGLCIDDNHGRGYDRFRGRVIFPIFNVTGKVVAFGGRTLRNDTAKYVNSPESLVYNKRNELYGLFQAKREIAKREKCFIVEGYADVISMHQAGFENVIASSGTALTEGHIIKIRRFTNNVTELFDGDAAGIHAALRGVNMLLSQGLNIRVLLLPEDEDPDSFARSHNSTEIQRYIEENEADFIKFKTAVLLKDYGNDPIKKAAAIGDIVKSIAVIPNQITRSVYAKECSSLLGIEESVILNEIQKAVKKHKEEELKRKERERNAAGSSETPQQPTPTGTPPPSHDAAPATAALPSPGNVHIKSKTTKRKNKLDLYETEVIRLVAKYGMCYLCESPQDSGGRSSLCVIEFINHELQEDRIEFSSPVYYRIFEVSTRLIEEFYRALDAHLEKVAHKMQELFKKGYQAIANEGITDTDTITIKEEALKKSVSATIEHETQEFREFYLEKKLCNHPDDNVRNISLELVSEKHHLSRIHTQFTTIATEYDRLNTLIPEAIFNWKNALVELKFQKLQQELKTANAMEATAIMEEMQKLNHMRKQLAKMTGERVVNPF